MLKVLGRLVLVGMTSFYTIKWKQKSKKILLLHHVYKCWQCFIKIYAICVNKITSYSRLNFSLKDDFFYHFVDCFGLGLYHKVCIQWQSYRWGALTNVDWGIQQSFDPQALIVELLIFDKLWYYCPKYLEGSEKFTPKDVTLDLNVDGP